MNPRIERWWLVLSLAVLPLAAQGEGRGRSEGAGAGAEVEAQSREEAEPRIKLSEGARAAIAAARELDKQARGKGGPERVRALEVAASAFDRVVGEFAGEPAASAYAAWLAADLWRRQGSLPLAEKDYLHAATVDPARYRQRGLFGVAEMQRRQQRTAEAMKTYQQAIDADPGSSRAQDARLWQARLMLQEEQVDRAIAAYQTALECAPTPALAIETANQLAHAFVHKGDLTAAERAIEHAEKVAEDQGDGDPIAAARLQRACERMTARKALRRALDERDGAADDAVRLDQELQGDRR